LCGFGTLFYRNAPNKANCFLDICKAKIIVFPEGAAFANAYTSARIFGAVCKQLKNEALNSITIPEEQRESFRSLFRERNNFVEGLRHVKLHSVPRYKLKFNCQM
jgi:hypothetical protein